MTRSKTLSIDAGVGKSTEFVTAWIGGQLFGFPIGRVQDVFMLDRLTRVPLAAPEIAGVLNLRGRIVTAIDMHQRLGLEKGENLLRAIAIGIECAGECYGLLIDSVGEVLKLADDACETNPANLDKRIARVSAGVYRLDGRLLMALDVDRILELGHQAIAA